MVSVGNVYAYAQNVYPYRLPLSATVTLSATVLLDPKAEEPEPEKGPEEGNPTDDHRSKAAPPLDPPPLRRMPDESWEDYENRMQWQRPSRCFKNKDGRRNLKVLGKGPDGGANCPVSSNEKRTARNARKKKRKQERWEEDVFRWLHDPETAKTIQEQRDSERIAQKRVHERRMKKLARRSQTSEQKRLRRWWPQEVEPDVPC